MTCTAQKPSDLAIVLYRLAVTAVASPCANPPSRDCHNCCWELSTTFTAGDSANRAGVNHSSTFILVGNGTKSTTTSPLLHIDEEKQQACTTDASATPCVRFDKRSVAKAFPQRGHFRPAGSRD